MWDAKNNVVLEMKRTDYNNKLKEKKYESKMKLICEYPKIILKRSKELIYKFFSLIKKYMIAFYQVIN